MDLVFNGKIIKALPHKTGVSKSTGNPWEIAEFVAEEVEGKYPKKMAFQISGVDRIKNINLQVGEVVSIHFDVDAHEWNGKYFNTITAFKIDRQGQQAPQQAQAPAPPAVGSQPAQAPANNGNQGADQELPF